MCGCRVNSSDQSSSGDKEDQYGIDLDRLRRQRVLLRRSSSRQVANGVSCESTFELDPAHCQPTWDSLILRMRCERGERYRRDFGNGDPLVRLKVRARLQLGNQIPLALSDAEGHLRTL